MLPKEEGDRKKPIFILPARNPVYAMVAGGLGLLVFFGAFYGILHAISSHDFYLLIGFMGVFAVLSVMSMIMISMWISGNPKCKFYEDMIRIDRFLNFFPMKIRYPDIAKIENYVPKNPRQEKFYRSNPFFIVRTRAGVRPKKIVVFNQKNETLGMDLETFIKSKIEQGQSSTESIQGEK